MARPVLGAVVGGGRSKGGGRSLAPAAAAMMGRPAGVLATPTTTQPASPAQPPPSGALGPGVPVRADPLAAALSPAATAPRLVC
jgi:hypothetical protein